MTPKDKGMLRELLHEYGPTPLILLIAKEGYGAETARFLQGLARVLEPSLITSEERAAAIRGPDTAHRWADD